VDDATSGALIGGGYAITRRRLEQKSIISTGHLVKVTVQQAIAVTQVQYLIFLGYFTVLFFLWFLLDKYQDWSLIW
jgi:hypothetical protein